MLNYRPSRRLGLTVVGEQSGFVYKMMVEEGRKMSFEGKPDPPKGKDDRELFTEDELQLFEARQKAEEELDGFLGPGRQGDPTDTKLTTGEFESVLAAKLRTVLREARLANEELGINTLFLTLGTLEWRETEERSYRAPLLFVPVSLEKLANGTVKIEHDGSDVGDNLPLRAKLAEFSLRLPEWRDDLGVEEYFAQVETLVRDRGWSVHRNEICVGFFNYEKYAMYVDLGGDAWPEGRKPWEHADLLAMLGTGYASADSRVDDDTMLDSIRSVEDSHEVYDADSSQTLAMVRAAEGFSFVVEGPPGTGKSQTITNMIAEAVAAGRTVLFVSAKRAALDVVKRRLEEADLGAMCLDLHDKLTNRREFYSEIKRTVNRSVNVQDATEQVARLGELRARLNAHSEAVNSVLPEFGISPFEAMVAAASLPAESPEDREHRIPFASLSHWRHRELRSHLPTLLALQSRIAQHGVPTQNPFWDCAISFLDPAQRADLQQDLQSSVTSFNDAAGQLAEAARALRIDPPLTARATTVLRRVAERAISAPPHDGLATRSATWRSDAPAVREAIATLRELQAARDRSAPAVAQEIFDADLLAVAQAYEAHSTKWYRFIIGDFRRARKTLAPYLRPGASTDANRQRDLVRDVRLVQESRARLLAQSPLLSRLFGVQWQGETTDPELIETLLNWVTGVWSELDDGSLPPGFLDLVGGNLDSATLMATVQAAEDAVQNALSQYRDVARALAFEHPAPEDEAIETLRERNANWLANLGELTGWIGLNEARRQAIQLGLSDVVSIADRWPNAGTGLADAVFRSYFAGVIRQAMTVRPELRTFERDTHEAMIAEFRGLDDFKLKYNRARVRLAHQSRLPSFENPAGNLLQLKIEAEKQRAHRPIRWTMSRSGEAIQRIKPVFMMSPLSVAIHLPPDLPPFDLVVFDEASQVRPEDALSAIVRAKQTIVVGDTRQMPPTSFFDRVADDDDLDEEEEGEAAELSQDAQKLESVLSLMSAVTMGRTRRPDLRWHYRSLHPSLIQPSNELFYESRLVVFPSADVQCDGRRVGVIFHHLADAVYEGGSRKRINPIEAAHVADAVLAHVRTSPEESLMVAAMNRPQADLIWDEVSKRERLDTAPFARYRELHPHEPLDVKNLENVQGDERDVVFISVTYGRDASGVVRQQFGPLLRDGGERRLNVLITRARRRCEVFSSITADDVRAEASGQGVTALKRYLRYAQVGDLEVAIPTGGEAESPFEEEVRAELEARGYRVDGQVGSEGYRIDLAVCDPASPGRYLIGVECDGATYHSARSARDRDKLRQRILESRGWRLHRIWSQDWWQDRQSEMDRLVRAIGSSATPTVSTPEMVHTPVIQESEVRTTGRSNPYRATPLRPITSEEEARRYVVEVVRNESPIVSGLLMARLRDAVGSSRAAKNFRIWAHGLFASCNLRIDGDAYYPNDEVQISPRDRSELPATERRLEYIPEVEFEAAVRMVLSESFGIGTEEAARATLRLLGFRRATEDAVSRTRDALARIAKERDGVWSLNTPADGSA